MRAFAADWIWVQVRVVGVVAEMARPQVSGRMELVFVEVVCLGRGERGGGGGG